MSKIRETRNQCPARVLEYRLNCGRTVYVEEIRISPSALGYLAGSKDAILADIVKRLPERAREQFPGNCGVFVKPLPEGELPAYTFMVALVCDHPVHDPTNDISSSQASSFAGWATTSKRVCLN